MGVCFRRLSKLSCWDLLLLSPTGMHALGWHHFLTSDPCSAPFSDSSLAAGIRMPAWSFPNRAQGFLLVNQGPNWG